MSVPIPIHTRFRTDRPHLTRASHPTCTVHRGKTGRWERGGRPQCRFGVPRRLTGGGRSGGRGTGVRGVRALTLGLPRKRAASEGVRLDVKGAAVLARVADGLALLERELDRLRARHGVDARRAIPRLAVEGRVARRGVAVPAPQRTSAAVARHHGVVLDGNVGLGVFAAAARLLDHLRAHRQRSRPTNPKHTTATERRGAPRPEHR